MADSSPVAQPRCPGKVNSPKGEGKETGSPGLKIPAAGLSRGSPKSDGKQRRRSATADSATQEDQCHPRKIFIGGLAHKTTTQNLRDHFGRYGTIVDAVVLRWPDGRSRGFGYVTFSEANGAFMVLQEDQHQVGGRQVDVKRAVPGTNKLFVGGLPQNTTAAELREHFEAYGVVSDAVVMIDPATNRSRGFGFVCFLPGQEGAASAQFALEQYQNHRLRGKWIEVKSAAPPHKLTKEGSASPSSPCDDLSALCGSPCSAASPVSPPATMDAFFETNPASGQTIQMFFDCKKKAAPVMSLEAALKPATTTAGPKVHDMPVASPARRRIPASTLEPQKVTLPGFVNSSPPGLGSTAAAANAAMKNVLGLPPGLSPMSAQDSPVSPFWTPGARASAWSPTSQLLSLSEALGDSPDFQGRDEILNVDLPFGEPADVFLDERNSLFTSSGEELQKSLEQFIRLKAQSESSI